ncbi:MAG: HPr family phosphocarrier protein [Spirochaetales bacterium]|nr:HPr family phosphocarrier protein [Leptospiraceae bacterium]MCP5480754.1 HPr family phosphocarrier protein [Spirochaetales bacterium]
MKSTELVIQQEEGLHARPASIFVRAAARFKCDVSLTAGGTTVNGKSIMGLLMLALSAGTKVTLTTDGVDEQEALVALRDMLSGNFE